MLKVSRAFLLTALKVAVVTTTSANKFKFQIDLKRSSIKFYAVDFWIFCIYFLHLIFIFRNSSALVTD